MAWTRKKRRGGRDVYLGCYRDADGNERSQQFDLKRDAKAWAEDREAEVRAGITAAEVTPATVTVAEWSRTWLATKLRIKERTRRGYIEVLDTIVLPAWRDVPLGDVTREGVERWVAQMTAAGRSPSRVRQGHQVLYAMLKLAALRGVIPANPAADVERPTDTGAKPRPPRLLDTDEIDRLAAAMEGRAGPSWRTWTYTVTYGALRFSESVALRRRHVDPAMRRLNVTDDAVYYKGRLLWQSAKTSGPVDLPAWVSDDLAAHLAERVPDDPDALVFVSPRGRPIRYGNVRRRIFDPAVRDCGWVPERAGGVTPHGLRHSCASILIASGANPKVVQAHMRHSSIQVTYDKYGHLFPGATADVWDRIDEARAAGAPIVDLGRARRARGA